MKTFEGLEDSLRNVGCVDNLVIALLSNGVKNVALDNCGVTFEVTPLGFVKNVPVAKWDASDVEFFGGKIKYVSGIVTVVCDVNADVIDRLREQYGVKFKFDEVSE